MLAIDSVLISDEIINNNFVCNLNACKGACCWEGDYGAPLIETEAKAISQELQKIIPILNKKSVTYLKSNPGYEYEASTKSMATSCHDDGSCVFLTKNEMGIAECGIQLANNKGLITIQKPLSCHLYPIRVTKNEALGFESWNYDRWDICSAACQKGDELSIPIYEFLKTAIIRYKGKDFYDQLEEAAKFMKKK